MGRKWVGFTSKMLTYTECVESAKKAAVSALFLGFAVCAYSQTSTVTRPRILGIDHVAFYTTDADGAKALYGGTLGLASAAPVEPGGLFRYLVGRQ